MPRTPDYIERDPPTSRNYANGYGQAITEYRRDPEFADHMSDENKRQPADEEVVDPEVAAIFNEESSRFTDASPTKRGKDAQLRTELGDNLDDERDHLSGNPRNLTAKHLGADKHNKAHQRAWTRI